MQTYTVLGKEYYLKIEADRQLSKVITHLIKTPRIEFAEFLADRVRDCFGLDDDGAIALCKRLGFDYDYKCSGFDENRGLKPIPHEPEDMPVSA